MEQNQLEIHWDNQIYAAIFTRYYFVIPSSKYGSMFRAGWNRIAENARQTVEGGVGRNCGKYLDKPGTKFRLSIRQSVDRGGGDELSNCVLPR